MNIVGEIRCYLGNEYAQLKFSESINSFSIDTVIVPASHRNKGIGKLLINHILCLADSMKKDVRLSARPLGAFSEEKLQRLVSYYNKFSFQTLDRGLTAVYMVRKAKESET